MAKSSQARIAANNRWNKKAYWQQLVRFQKDEEEEIRYAAEAAGTSLNAFMRGAVMRAVEESGRLQETEPGGSEAPKGGSMEPSREAPNDRTGEAPNDRAGDVVFQIDAETAEELRGAGIEPEEMLSECIRNRIEEIRAGIY